MDDRLVEQLEEVIARPHATEPFAGVVSLRRGDAILFERAYGDALREESIPNRPGTRFQIASGCKTFTAVAIQQLIEEGELGLDAALADCADVPLPELSPAITIRHLLTHTSGIPDYFDEEAGEDYEHVWRERPMYRMRRPADFLPLLEGRPMRAAPGSAFSYSNAGYVLLGLVVEQRTGMAFADYVTERILRPCGMRASGYLAADRLPPGTARAYIEEPDGTWRSNIYAVPILGGPDGGAYTTAADMARFWQGLGDGTLLRAPTAARLLAPQVVTGRQAPYDRYGLGVWIESAPDGVRKRFAEGADPGVAFRSAIYPRDDLILTMLANTASALWARFREIEALVAPTAPAG